MTEYKTILAPNAPWPNKPAQKQKTVAKKTKNVAKKTSKQQKTDEMFNLWRERNAWRLT